MLNSRFREGNIIFKERYLEEGLNVSRKRSAIFTVIMVSIFVINSTAAGSAIMSIPNLLYESDYLCKDPSGEFKIICKKDFVCNEKHAEDLDYILDKNKFKTSFITQFNIYCSDTKISLFGTSYFFGGFIGLLIAPEILKWVGNIELIVYASSVCMICNIALYFTTNYYVGIISYTVSMISRNILQVPATQYQIEMLKGSERAFILGLNMAMNSMTGILVNFMEITTGDYKGEILTNTLLFIFSIVFVKLFLVESVRNTYLKGKYLKIIDDLEYIAEVNGSQLEFNEWKDKIILESKEELENDFSVAIEDENQKNKYKMINYWNIWKLKSVVKLIVFFTLFTSLNQFLLMFLLFEQKNQKNNFYMDSIICYLVDMAGSFVGAFLVDTEYFKRRLTAIYGSSFAGVGFILTGVSMLTINNINTIFLNRFLNSALGTVLFTWGFENFPSLVRNHGFGIIRVSSRLINLGTPFFMVSYSLYLYFIAGILDLFLVFLIFSFNINETKGKVLEEFPEEMRMSKMLMGLEKEDDVVSLTQSNK